jgi:hypothetical protein
MNALSKLQLIKFKGELIQPCLYAHINHGADGFMQELVGEARERMGICFWAADQLFELGLPKWP